MVDDYFMLQIVFSFIPLIIITIFLILIKTKYIDFKNGYFWGLISLIMAYTFNYLIEFIWPSINIYYKYGNSISKFIAFLISFGLVEEISRYLSLKFSKPKTKYQILINLIYISLIFAAYENYSYIGVANNPLHLAIIRAFTPVHLLFAIIMAYFLIKSFTAKQENHKILRIVYEFLAIIIPIIFHTIYDYIMKDYPINMLNIWIIGLIAILAYGCTFFVIYKNNKNCKDEIQFKNKKVINIFKIIFIVLFSLFYIYAFNV